jgi:hypothetical protein
MHAYCVHLSFIIRRSVSFRLSLIQRWNWLLLLLLMEHWRQYGVPRASPICAAAFKSLNCLQPCIAFSFLVQLMSCSLLYGWMDGRSAGWHLVILVRACGFRRLNDFIARIVAVYWALHTFIPSLCRSIVYIIHYMPCRNYSCLLHRSMLKQSASVCMALCMSRLFLNACMQSQLSICSRRIVSASLHFHM